MAFSTDIALSPYFKIDVGMICLDLIVDNLMPPPSLLDTAE